MFSQFGHLWKAHPIPFLTSLFKKQIGRSLQSDEKLMKIRHYYREASRPGNDKYKKKYLCFRIVSKLGTVYK